MLGAVIGRIGAGRLSRQSWMIVGWVAFVVAISLILRAIVPVFVIGDALFDDLLFVRSASSLLHHAWLGPFDNLTLAKGPAFSAFVAVCYAVGMPLLIGEQLVHLVAAGAAACAVARVTSKRAVGVVTFTALALDPAYLGAASSRVTRDSLYSSVCLLLFGVLVLAPTFSRLVGRSRWRRITYVLVVGMSGGVLLACYWLGREEWPWLIPALGLALLLPAIRGWRRLRRRAPSDASKRRPIAKALRDTGLPHIAAGLLAVAVFGGLMTSIAMVNRTHYGSFITNDFNNGQFPRVYSEWQSVQAGVDRRYVPISHAQRLAVYRVSAAARELQPYMEGPLQSWVQPGCDELHICDDFAAGWIPWALRDAVSESGHYGSEAEAQAFLSRLGDEIASACSAGTLNCGWRMPAMLPTPSRFNAGAFLRSIWNGATSLVSNELADETRPLSDAKPQNWALFTSTLRGLPVTLGAQQANETTALPRAQGLWPLKTVYGLATLVTLPFAVGGYGVALWRRRGGSGAAWGVGMAAGVAVISRLFLVALIDSTSFPTSQGQYELPATGFLLVFVMVGLWLLKRNLESQSSTLALT